MEENNKGLVVVAKTFFKRVKEFVLNLFKKEDEKINENTVEEFEAKTDKNEIAKVEDNTDERDEFFKKYEAFKAEKIDVSELSGSELVKMNAMLEEETKLNKQKLQNALNEFNKKNSEESDIN